MRNVLILALVALFSLQFGHLAAQNSTIHFESGSRSLTKADKAQLRAFVEKQANKILTIDVTGHADNVGQAANNHELSFLRAQSVATYLSELKMEIRTVKGKGSAFPISGNESPEGRKMNRRVEIALQFAADADEGISGNFILQKEAATVADEITIRSIVMEEVVHDKMQREEKPEVVRMTLRKEGMEVDCNKEYFLTGPFGSELHIPAYTFECDDTSKYWLNLEEYTSPEVAREKNIPTMTVDGELLESAGMVIFVITKDRIPMEKLPNGKTVDFFIPAKKYDKEMRLYHAANWNRRKRLKWNLWTNNKPRWSKGRKGYKFSTGLLGGINIDKPAMPNNVGVLVRVKRGMLKGAAIYASYGERGTYSRGQEYKRYIGFGEMMPGEEIHLEGILDEKQFKLRKTIIFTGNEKVVKIEGKKYYVIADMNRRAINKTDRWVGPSGE